MKKYFLFFIAIVTVGVLQAQMLTTRLDSVLTVYSRNGKFNGTALVAQKGKVLLERGYGVKNATDKTMNDRKTIFQIGSVTKQFTAIIILKLQEMGKLSVQDRLSKYFPEIAWADKVTIENLLTHTAGIYNYTTNKQFMEKDAVKPATEAVMLALFKDKPLEFEPGSKFNYSNSGYVLLGYIIEKATGKPYEQVVREFIFDPLQMNNSGFDFTNLQSDDKATGYDELTESKQVAAGIVDSSASFSAGAIYSTVNDLHKWDRALYTDKVVSKSSLLQAYTPYKINHYGYGWGTDSIFGKKAVQHSGGIFGFTSYILRELDDEIVVVLLDNSGNGGLGSIAGNLLAVVSGKAYKLPSFRKEIKVDAVLLQQYVGMYELSPNFIITITLENGQLKAQATGQPKFDLFAMSDKRFFLKVIDAEVAFDKGNDGKVERMILYQDGNASPGKKIK